MDIIRCEVWSRLESTRNKRLHLTYKNTSSYTFNMRMGQGEGCTPNERLGALHTFRVLLSATRDAVSSTLQNLNAEQREYCMEL